MAAKSKSMAKGMSAGKTKSTKNIGKPWTNQDLQMLRRLANENTPTRVMGLKLGRTEASVRSKAKNEGISLKPVNQSPFG